jgi:acetylornithine deacetylase/succinyl-diaminopimelate desuccinylase-like protein
MVAMAALARAGVPFGGTLIFGSEVGEEGGGWKINELLDGPGACDLGICAEPTNLELHPGCRGGLPLTFRTIGVATHTGTADKGVNAILKMAKVIPAIYALECFQRVDPLWGRSPVNAMIIRGGGKVSASVPDECEVIWDIRLNPDLPPDEAAAAIDAALDRLRAEDPDLKIEVKRGREMGGRAYLGQPAAHLPPDHPLVQAVSAAAASVLGRPPKLAGFPGGCSTGVMIRRGTPSVIFGPGNLEQAHSADEWVEVDQLVAAARVYAAIALRLLSAPEA